MPQFRSKINKETTCVSGTFEVSKYTFDLFLIATQQFRGIIEINSAGICAYNVHDNRMPIFLRNGIKLFFAFKQNRLFDFAEIRVFLLIAIEHESDQLRDIIFGYEFFCYIMLIVCETQNIQNSFGFCCNVFFRRQIYIKLQ